MAQRAMSEVGAARGVMIGDTTYDMEMGRTAGLKTIGVSWGYHSGASLLKNADLVVNNFENLLPAILEIWND